MPGPHPAYDRIGARYEEYARKASFKQAERHTFLELVGPLRGESVLDLACGFGYYSRLLKERGAGRVVGVDVSPEMIRLAREGERADPRGVEYLVADAAEPAVPGAFDLVTAIWMLNYASSVERLEAMLRNVRAHLVPGGRFVGITINPDFDLARGNCTKYGVEMLSQSRVGEHRVLTGRFVTEPPSETLEVAQWSRETYEAAFRTAGLREPHWEPYRVPTELVAEHGEAYWQDLRANGTGIAVTARA